ncbi:Checkpoint kinase 2 [Arthrobotrys musiformis]|uniref:Checkpoint kinase 2 n=1 Tax=Arthrobotrys musiformis TaxID=47236 RepID=A0AAV9W3Q8_9PEZI
MESIAEIARACFRRFEELTGKLTDASAGDRESMPPDRLEWEFSRFKIWCGNLGALQVGSSSLDSRLRESTVVRNNVFKHLTRLARTLVESTEVVSGERLPLEQQPQPDDSSSDSSSEESESDDELPKELVLHMVSIKEILSDLYMLSFRIRNNSTRPTPALRVELYAEIDDETGKDKLAAYTQFDKRHIEDSLLQLRRDAANEMGGKASTVDQINDSDQYLVDRLVATMSKRRRFLRYWLRHAEKIAEVPKDIKLVIKQPTEPEPQHDKIAIPVAKTSSQQLQPLPIIAAKSILSMTEATKFDEHLDDKLEVQSVISYVSARVDIDGNETELPPPPIAASQGTEYLCPYCGIVCPARHGKGSGWRAHVLRDLQPYICTYNECDDGNRLFSSRTAWLEHERLVHRRIWQCFEHVEPKFGSKVALQDHLKSEHGNDITDLQIQNLVEICESSVEDTRDICPFCLLEGPFPTGLANHMALHMQRFATFPISRDISACEDEDDIGADDRVSGHVQGLGSRGSQSLLSGSLRFGSQPPSYAASDIQSPSKPNHTSTMISETLTGIERSTTSDQDSQPRSQDVSSIKGESQMASDLVSYPDRTKSDRKSDPYSESLRTWNEIQMIWLLHSETFRRSMSIRPREPSERNETLEEDLSKRSDEALNEVGCGLVMRFLLGLEGYRGVIRIVKRTLKSLIRTYLVALTFIWRRLVPNNDDEAPKSGNGSPVKWPLDEDDIRWISSTFRDIENEFSHQLKIMDACKKLDQDGTKFAQNAKLPHYDFRGVGRRTGVLQDQGNALSKAKEWPKHPFRPPILWLHGPDETEVLIVASLTTEFFQRNGWFVGSSFCFDQTDSERKNTSRTFTTMAIQLLQEHPRMISHIIRAIDGDPDIVEKPLIIQLEKLLIEPLSSCYTPQETLIFMIGALDECEDPEYLIAVIIYVIRKRFKENPNSVTPLFLITSRTNSSIRNIIGKSDRTLVQEVSLSGAPLIDTESVISEHLGRSLHVAGMEFNGHTKTRVGFARKLKPLPEDWPSTSIIEKLSRMANGSLANARFISKSIQDIDYKSDPQTNLLERLDTILEKGIPSFED